MSVEIKVPAVGESITEATIGEWQKKSGDFVSRDDVLLVLETDKASVEVVAETDGILTTKANEGDTVAIGSVVGEIDNSASAPKEAAPAKTPPTPQPVASTPPPAAPQPNIHQDLKSHLSPATRRVVEENHLNPSTISGTGRGGRLTKEDALVAASNGSAASQTKASQQPQALPPLPQAKGAIDATETREKMTTIRKKIAERLVSAQQTAAILTTFNEIDMSAAMKLRAKYKDSFKEKYGISLGFMGLFVKAAIEALKAFPKVNAFIDGDEVVYHNYQNIGVAVSTEKGLMVPVIKNAQAMSVAEIELAIRHYAIKARDGKISIDDLNGGTFTLSNGGVFGSLMSTPILNPPQSGILGMHKIEERPIAIDGKVEIRPMMYVALSYDHRMVDGRESVGFLVKIKEGMEDPARLLLEI
ncbi:MAG: 2-oxoglutarate dehydrogenase complex dihydrolipoyllysine-residue succinyltransferase [Bdellovibrionales bacterium]|nr:2-oxoglutarate dehydrogenase complex dihydrolipoyllysine-residue succinyltransferase [Bdellovibrionales bacterium]